MEIGHSKKSPKGTRQISSENHKTETFICYLNWVVAEIMLLKGKANLLWVTRSGSGCCGGILRTSRTKLETIQITKEDQKWFKRLKSGSPPGFWISQRTDLLKENFPGLEAEKNLSILYRTTRTGFLDVVARRSKVNLVQVKSREESCEHSNESYCYFLLYCSLCYAKYLESVSEIWCADHWN